jgi:hypothetical protein
MVPSFLVSLLSRQLELLGPDGFFKQHPHAWLLWEPGAWQSPSSAHESETGSTRLPVAIRPTHPGVDDALCFELVCKPDVETWLTGGRGSGNDLVLNDMTVSRDQFRLVSGPDGWALHDAPGGAATPRLLGGQATLSAGGLTLTFYEPPAFLDRLAHERASRAQ